ncbi:MAG: hypothetical protein AABZ39_06115 [Spirochaetota bacterium]|mgnify:CR=1 FL=1
MKPDIIRTERDYNMLMNEFPRMKLSGIIVLTGSETLFKKKFIHAVETRIFPEDAGRDFNHTVIYGEDAEPIADVCNTAPMGHPMRLVVIHGYEQGNTDGVIEYASHPSSATLLILDTDKKLADDVLHKEGLADIRFIDFPEPDERDIREWTVQYCRARGKMISKDAVNYLVDNMRLGYHDMEQELVKIIDFHADKELIDIGGVKDFTHTTKMDVGFEFAEALLAKDARKAYTLLRRTDRSLPELAGLVFYKFLNLHYIVLYGKASTQEIAKAAKVNPWALEQDRKYAATMTLSRSAWLLAEIQELNRVLVSTPKNIQRAYFDTFIFSVTRAS